MRLKTVLNRVHKVKGFVYQKARFVDGRIEVDVRPRKGSPPACSPCGRSGPGYDTLPTRRFRFVPRWGLAVFFVYAMRRVDCPTCGVTVEMIRKTRSGLSSPGSVKHDRRLSGMYVAICGSRT